MLNRRVFISGLTAFWPVGRAAHAQTPQAKFLEGETIKWIVPYRPGGGYDEYSRLIAPVLETYTGARVDLVNLPGGGGMRGAAEIFRAPSDGLHIGIVNGSGLIANSLNASTQLEWDFQRYSFIGRVSAEPRVMIVGAQSPIMDYASLQNAGRTLVCGATGIGGSTYVDAVLAGQVLGLEQKVIHGFDNSADIRLALLRGDIDCMWGSLGSAYDGLSSGDFRAVLTKVPAADPILSGTQDVSTVAGDALSDPQRQALFDAWVALSEIGRPVVGPPDIPEDRLTVLRDALNKSLTDTALMAAARDANRSLNPLPGPEIAVIAAQFDKIDAETRAMIVAAVQGNI